MVHALEKVHRLLAPGGWLIDIHPTEQPPALEVRSGEQVTLAGWVHETDDYIEYAQASEALEAVRQRGLYDLEDARTFDFLTHAGSLSELLDHLSQEWKDAFIDERTAGKVEELLLSAEPDREVRIRETVNIARLRARRG